MGMGASLGMGSTLGDSLSQSRSQYQSGYLMSVQQHSMLPQGSQRHDDAPMVQTKAKLNQSLAGGSALDFGMDSMFESSRQRQRQPLTDEDAPPTASVNDIVNEVYSDSGPSRLRNSAFDSSASRGSLYRSSFPSTPKPSVAQTSQSQPLYVIVFGYPPDKYTLTAEYFHSLGETTEPEHSTEISNAFRIGFFNPAEAMRAVRKNGEVLGGEWMIGAKWADPAQAEALLGATLRGGYLSQSPEHAPEGPGNMSPSGGFTSSTGALFQPSTSRGAIETSGPAVGTPIRLAPSAAAFRKGGTGAAATPQKLAFPAVVSNVLPGGAVSPSKGVMEHVSDLIFGW